MNVELLGWIGSFFFMICGIPQAWQSYKHGNSNGVNSAFLVFWLLGELFTLSYTILHLNSDLPIISNLIVNIIFIVIIMKYKYFPRTKD